jgi:hypothetical protein
MMEKYKILRGVSDNNGTGSLFNIPLFLENKIDEMGIMVGFDGDIEQIDQLVNFLFTIDNKTIKVYNTTNTDKFRNIIQQNFSVSWGDGELSKDGLSLNGELEHTYLKNGKYEIKVSLDTPWSNEVIVKFISIPEINPNIIENSLGTFTILNIPEYGNTNPTSIDYMNDLDNTENLKDATFRYVGIGGSRLDELKKYGEDKYEGVTIGSDDVGEYTGYTFEYINNGNTMTLYYRDYSDNVTMITGSTVGFNREEIFDTMLTRNEHFLGFVDDPSIFSDVFVERGKQGVMEKNLRLSEIDNIGELVIYGNGFFKIRKQ